ncbi:hypothetical protein GPECTOR_149g32 [Gonium pectorale]|uniref:Uncharacterized protein n=1 Tax=Gonium pectorale TaxID=33097 RepID=A0A150FXS8_GONPE|nr:hypothetical protein GPECTOR_149g32 [Gonium pectorale]|eukprot:KXZ42422.1 hypothetical protein GPECTOR_149g32 [Gonium pectorale]
MRSTSRGSDAGPAVWLIPVQPTPLHTARDQPPRSGLLQRARGGLLAVCLALQLLLAPPSPAVLAPADPDLDTMVNVPAQLSAQGERAVPPLSGVVSGPKRREIESCVRKCVPTCTRGGEGAPGLGPLTMRREVVVFKEGFRSRQYCLSECAQVCALSLDRDKAALLLPQGQEQGQEQEQGQGR